MCTDHCSFCIWGESLAKSWKMCKNISFSEYFRGFSAEKTDHLCMNNYGEIIGLLLTFSIHVAMTCEICMTNPLNSSVVLYWPVSIILDDFWTSGHYVVSQNCDLWNWAQKMSLGKHDIDWLYTAIFASRDKFWLSLKKIVVIFSIVTTKGL